MMRCADGAPGWPTQPADALSLTDAELVSALLGVEAEALPAIERHLHHIGGLERLVVASVDELVAAGFCTKHAQRIPIAVELVCRAQSPRARGLAIFGPEQVYALLAPRLVLQEQEHFIVLCLDGRNRVLRVDTVTIGTSRYTVIDPAVVYRLALRLGAVGIVVAHNHPSNDPSPSEQDIQVTRRLAEAGQVLGIPLLDHVVVAREGFTSLAATGILGGIPAVIP